MASIRLRPVNLISTHLVYRRFDVCVEVRVYVQVLSTSLRSLKGAGAIVGRNRVLVVGLKKSVSLDFRSP